MDDETLPAVGSEGVIMILLGMVMESIFVIVFVGSGTRNFLGVFSNISFIKK